MFVYKDKIWHLRMWFLNKLISFTNKIINCSLKFSWIIEDLILPNCIKMLFQLLFSFGMIFGSSLAEGKLKQTDQINIPNQLQ